MYTEVFQDSCLDAMRAGRLTAASACALTLSEDKLQELYDDFDSFGPRIVLRPQEISNNPAVIRQLGVIAINTAIEVDIYGHVNSTHVCGTQLMNGLGGAGDFERNARLSVFVCHSTAKGGRISSIVPFCTHVDHSEHSAHVIVTEQGLADLRGLGPAARAQRIIDSCAHPAYRDYLHHYVEQRAQGHIRHDLARCFELHRNFEEHGAMLPDLDLSSSRRPAASENHRPWIAACQCQWKPPKCRRIRFMMYSKWLNIVPPLSIADGLLIAPARHHDNGIAVTGAARHDTWPGHRARPVPSERAGRGPAPPRSPEPSHEVLVGLVLAPQNGQVALAESRGHRADVAAVDGARVHLDHRGDVGRRAAGEHLVGDVELREVHLALVRRDAEVGGHCQYRAAVDALQQVAGRARGDEHPIAHDEDVGRAELAHVPGGVEEDAVVVAAVDRVLLGQHRVHVRAVDLEREGIA